MELYDDLAQAAALDQARAVIRIITTYEPAGGPSARVYPPTYPIGQAQSPYVIDQRRIDGEERDTVLLDSVPSQANRAEEALLRASREGRIHIPVMTVEHSPDVAITSLEAPHRYADAYLRDSTMDGTPFDRSQLGAEILAASPKDASALFKYDPGSLVYGAWNSHRKGRQTKFPRAYCSEIVGLDPAFGGRRAGRMDPLNLRGAVVAGDEGWEFKPAEGKAGTRAKDKGSRLSEIGHGNIAPNETHGGVTITNAIRICTLSFAALDRLGFGTASRGGQIAARAALAAYALVGDRLAFGGGSVWLRSGCELVVANETIEWIGRGAEAQPFELDTPSAVELFAFATDAASRAGLSMSTQPILLKPNKALADAIDFALTLAPADD